MAWRNDRLRAVRKEQNMTREVLAGLVDAHPRMIARYEDGDSDPTADVLIKLAQALGISADYLLGLSDDARSGYIERDLTSEEQEVIMAMRAHQSAKLVKHFAARLQSD